MPDTSQKLGLLTPPVTPARASIGRQQFGKDTTSSPKETFGQANIVCEDNSSLLSKVTTTTPPSSKANCTTPPTSETNISIPPTSETDIPIPPTSETDIPIPPTSETNIPIPPTSETNIATPLTSIEANITPFLTSETNITTRPSSEANIATPLTSEANNVSANLPFVFSGLSKPTKRATKCHRQQRPPMADIANTSRGYLSVTAVDSKIGDQHQPKRYKRKQNRPSQVNLSDTTIDESKCSVCHGEFIEGEEKKWVGCNYCTRWFHKKCVKAVIKKKWKCPFEH